MGESLPRSEILRGKKMIGRIFREGKRVESEGIYAFWLPEDKNAAGFYVHKKAGNAVKRNRIRRLIRESYRKQKSLFPDNTAIMFAVYAELIDNTLDFTMITVKNLAEKIRSQREHD